MHFHKNAKVKVMKSIVWSIPVWSGGMDFEEIGQKQNRSFWNVVLEKNT